MSIFVTNRQTYSVTLFAANGEYIIIPPLTARAVVSDIFNWDVPVSVSWLQGPADTLSTVALPSISRPHGVYWGPITINLNCATAGASLYYTTDGSTPTTALAPTLPNTTITIASTTLLRIFAAKAGMKSSPIVNYTFTLVGTPLVPAPTFNKASGSYPSPFLLQLSSPMLNAAIYYTTDGSVPTTASTLYNGSISVTSSMQVRAIAVWSGYSSPVASQTFYVSGSIALPVFTPLAGTYLTSQTVAISCLTSNVSIYYTTNGSTPTPDSSLYSTPVTVAVNETLKAIAVLKTPVATAIFAIEAAQPTFSPVAGTYGPAQSVTISSGTAGATIYYTTDGSTPTTGSSVYGSPVSVAASKTLKAIAVHSGLTNSPVGSAAYTITGSRDTLSIPTRAFTLAGTATLTPTQL